MRFEGEEVKVVANGAGWVAAVTSLNLLRIFSEGGLQVSSFALYSLSCVKLMQADRLHSRLIVVYH